MATVFGIAASVATAYVAAQFNNIMDVLQLVFAFVNAPLLATFLLGMFWKRATGHGAFTGLLSGTAAAAIHHGLTLPIGAAGGVKGGWLAVVHAYPSEMAQNFWTAIYAFTVCFVVTIAVSVVTRRARRARARRPRALADGEAARRADGLVSAAGDAGHDRPRGHVAVERGVFLMPLDIRVPIGAMLGLMGAAARGLRPARRSLDLRAVARPEHQLDLGQRAGGRGGGPAVPRHPEGPASVSFPQWRSASALRTDTSQG